MSDKQFHGGEALARAVEKAYEQGGTDYSLEPMSLYGADGKPVGKVKDGDHVVFCCRRGEREIELTEAFTDPDFTHFQRDYMPNLDFAIMTMYHEKFKNLPIAFAPERVQKPLAQVLSEAGLRQFHCSESEKFAHVTFFFNGGYNQPFPGEDNLCVPSPKGIPFDQKPELSLPTVAEKVKGAVEEGYDFIVTNFANGDVIGHTSNREAKLIAAAAISRYVDEVAHFARSAAISSRSRPTTATSSSSTPRRASRTSPTRRTWCPSSCSTPRGGSSASATDVWATWRPRCLTSSGWKSRRR